MEIHSGKSKIKVFCYFCDSCDERFYTEKLTEPDDVQCPLCGSDEVAISSAHIEELNR